MKGSIEMKKIVTICVLAATLTSTGYAGGKNGVPAAVPVVPIVEPMVDPIPLYIGAGLIWAGMSRDCSCAGDAGMRLKETTYGGIIRAGWDFNRYIGIEARALKGSLQSDFSKTTHYGLFLKPMYHVTDQINAYGLLGYGRTEIDCDSGMMQSTYTNNGFSWGAGVEYDLTSDKSLGAYSRDFDGQGDQEKSWGLWADYQNLLNNDGPKNIKSNIVTVGITYDF